MRAVEKWVPYSPSSKAEQTEQLGEEVRLIAGLQMGSKSTPRKVASCQLIREHAH